MDEVVQKIAHAVQRGDQALQKAKQGQGEAGKERGQKEQDSQALQKENDQIHQHEKEEEMRTRHKRELIFWGAVAIAMEENKDKQNTSAIMDVLEGGFFRFSVISLVCHASLQS